MKRILVLCLMIALIASAGISAFATTGAFVSSPSLNPAPEIIEEKNEDEDCDALLVITAYADRDELPAEARQSIEEAYIDICGTKDLSTLNEMIAKIAKKMGVPVTDLAASDLFDISANGCTGNHEDHGLFDITLKSDTLNNFVCLLHYYNGEWIVVDNAIVTQNGEHLEFEEKEFSPFAIVVYTGDEDITSPVKDNNVAIIVAAAVAGAAVLSALIFFILFLLKKNKDKDEEEKK